MPQQTADTTERNRYLRLVPLSVATCTVELGAGVLTGSLALITDAVHTLLDVLENLVNAFVAERARFLRDSDQVRKLGFAVSLVLIALSTGFMVHEAAQRLIGRDTPQLAGWTIAIAVFSLTMNLWQLHIHFGAPDEHRNLTHWGQALHIMTDVAGSLAAIGGTVTAVLFGYPVADAWAAITIVAIIWGRMAYGARQAFGRQGNDHHRHCGHRH